jgi:hypothetical protein
MQQSQIDVLQMNIPKGFPEFELFQVECLYPAPTDGIIGIKKGEKLYSKRSALGIFPEPKAFVLSICVFLNWFIFSQTNLGSV